MKIILEANKPYYVQRSFRPPPFPKEIVNITKNIPKITKIQIKKHKKGQISQPNLNQFQKIKLKDIKTWKNSHYNFLKHHKQNQLQQLQLLIYQKSRQNQYRRSEMKIKLQILKKFKRQIYEKFKHKCIKKQNQRCSKCLQYAQILQLFSNQVLQDKEILQNNDLQKMFKSQLQKIKQIQVLDQEAFQKLRSDLSTKLSRAQKINLRDSSRFSITNKTSIQNISQLVKTLRFSRTSRFSQIKRDSIQRINSLEQQSNLINKLQNSLINNKMRNSSFKKTSFINKNVKNKNSNFSNSQVQFMRLSNNTTKGLNEKSVRFSKKKRQNENKIFKVLNNENYQDQIQILKPIDSDGLISGQGFNDNQSQSIKKSRKKKKVMIQEFHQQTTSKFKSIERKKIQSKKIMIDADSEQNFVRRKNKKITFKQIRPQNNQQQEQQISRRTARLNSKSSIKSNESKKSINTKSFKYLSRKGLSSKKLQTKRREGLKRKKEVSIQSISISDSYSQRDTFKEFGTMKSKTVSSNFSIQGGNSNLKIRLGLSKYEQQKLAFQVYIKTSNRKNKRGVLRQRTIKFNEQQQKQMIKENIVDQKRKQLQSKVHFSEQQPKILFMNQVHKCRRKQINLNDVHKINSSYKNLQRQFRKNVLSETHFEDLNDVNKLIHNGYTLNQFKRNIQKFLLKRNNQLQKTNIIDFYDYIQQANENRKLKNQQKFHKTVIKCNQQQKKQINKIADQCFNRGKTFTYQIDQDSNFKIFQYHDIDLDLIQDTLSRNMDMKLHNYSSTPYKKNINLQQQLLLVKYKKQCQQYFNKDKQKMVQKSMKWIGSCYQINNFNL